MLAVSPRVILRCPVVECQLRTCSYLLLLGLPIWKGFTEISPLFFVFLYSAMDILGYHQRQCCAFRALCLRCKLSGIKTAFHRALRQKPSPSALQTGATRLQELPPEIMNSIVDDLPLLAKACLALTCRTFTGYWEMF